MLANATAQQKKLANDFVSKMLGLDAEFEKQKTQGDEGDKAWWKLAKKFKEKAKDIFTVAFIKNEQQKEKDQGRRFITRSD